MKTTKQMNMINDRTAQLLAYYKGLPGEFMMLKGLLCMSHIDDPYLKDALNGMMVAERMDALNRGEK